ncbi:Ger(x)C family spore germination protein [Clostridium swellfunianum]|uniref:Ger(x)C family spore germination protein n=1 Tax=Clostridium swellfunianum TaxID=1367462 RepID=UPI00202E6F0C|nr:Ger(x)C family spore germination protein [Clostridium swellfunianum]MCM0649760.1 Ger(x)C family spore germination protein [Clostridium swellfunianum]
MRLKKILSLALCCLLLSGCWDKIEIDRKIFVSVIGIDLGSEAGKEKQKDAQKIMPNEPFQGRVQQKKLNIIYGFPDISELGPGKAGTAKDQFINVNAASMEDGILEATSRSSRSIHLGQTKLIVLSSSVLEDPDTFKEILDYFERHPNLNKMMNVVVAQGKAEDYVKFKAPMEKNIEYYLSGLMESSKRNATILPVTLNEMIILLAQNGNAIIPKISIEKEKNEITLSGLAVVKNYSLKGYLTPIEVANLEIMRGKIRGGKRVIYKEGHPVDINIEDISREVKVSGDKNKLKFDMNIRLEGQLRSYYKDKDVFSKEILKSLETDFSKSISEECNVIARMLQNEFAVDPIGLREYLEQRKPSIWKQVKDNWEEAYKNSDINVTVDTKIRRIGVIR